MLGAFKTCEPVNVRIAHSHFTRNEHKLTFGGSTSEIAVGIDSIYSFHKSIMMDKSLDSASVTCHGIFEFPMQLRAEM